MNEINNSKYFLYFNSVKYILLIQEIESSLQPGVPTGGEQKGKIFESKNFRERFPKLTFYEEKCYIVV